jgi:hypothetical protein
MFAGEFAVEGINNLLTWSVEASPNEIIVSVALIIGFAVVAYALIVKLALPLALIVLGAFGVIVTR